MSRTWFTPIAGSSDNTPQRRPNRADPEDTGVLDAYSQAVINVVRSVSPAVVSLTGQGQGMGSGFLISPEGYALTNSHVVGGRKQLVAETAEGDALDATVLGDDPATDLALLRIAADGLPYCELGNSQAVQVGQLVIAMGSPWGLHSTVSTGVISAVGRSMRGQDGRLIEDVLQHAAPINPGNSGGPLIDSRGHVVGVNTAIIAAAQGIGFAVPSNTAQWVAEQLRSHGEVPRRRLGIVARSEILPRRLIRELDLLSEHVVEVVEILPGSVGAAMGLRVGDQLIALNDRLLTSMDDLHRLLAAIPENAEVELTFLRDGTQHALPMRW